MQCGIGLYLTSSVVPAGQAHSAAVLTEAINRLDGVKMFVLAAMAIAGTVMAIETGLLPRWLRWTGVALAAAIVASGVGYAFLNAAMAMAAWLSLPLLIVWVAGSASWSRGERGSRGNAAIYSSAGEDRSRCRAWG